MNTVSEKDGYYSLNDRDTLEKIVQKTYEVGFEINKYDAILISENSAVYNWTIDESIDKYIKYRSFNVKLEHLACDQPIVCKFCELHTSENIENYPDDNLYYMYGYSKKEMLAMIGEKISTGDKILEIFD